MPGLALDRTGIALLGAIALHGGGRDDARPARHAVALADDRAAVRFMVMSAQLRLGGFYTRVVRAGSPRASSRREDCCAAILITAGGLSAVLTNDIVCLAMAPLLVERARCRGWIRCPFLLALACAANVGSAATLIGNPQNMLIGQTLRLVLRGLSALDAACRRCSAWWWCGW